MSLALVAHTSQSSTGGNGVGPTSAINTTGEDAIIVAVASHGPAGAVAPTDSLGNTLTFIGSFTPAGSDGLISLFYNSNPTGGSGNTFSVPGSGNFPAIAVGAFSGTQRSIVLDGYTGNNGSSSLTTIQPGSLTPSVSGCLMIAACAHHGASGSSISINSGFTMLEQKAFVGSNAYGVAIAYKFKSDAAAENPTFTNTTTGAAMSAIIAAFKPVSAPVIASTSPLSDVTQGVSTNHTLAASGGTGSLTWTKISGSASVSLNSSTGVESDSDTTTLGSRTLTAKVTDTLSVDSAPVTLTWDVVAPPLDLSTFPTDVATGIPYFHYDMVPRDFESVTDSYEYEDGNKDFNERSANPPRIWNITFIQGLSKAQTDIFDEFWEGVRKTQTFTFVDKYGDTYAGVRVKDYSRAHEANKAWDKTVSFVLVQYAPTDPT